MRVNYAILLIILTGAVSPWSEICAAERKLECQGVGKSRHFTLGSVSVAPGFEKVVLTGPSEIKHEYLVEGVRKIPVGDERALVGSMVSAHAADKQHELTLEPDSYFEMYESRDTGGSSAAENVVFVFDHHSPVSEILNLKTGERIRDEHSKKGRISLDCDQYPEYLQYIEQLDSVTASATPGWYSMREMRMQDLAARFASAYIDHNLVFNNRFLGVEIWQNPFDMWVFQQMITELRPDVIIETGTAHGGSALFFAVMLEKVNPSGRVITIEIDPDVDNNVRKARSFPVFSDRVRIIKGDSVSSRTLARVHEVIEEVWTDKNAGMGSSAQQDLTVLVTLDSLHSAEHVLEELRLYSRFVSKGSYIVVQDTIIDRNPKFVDWFVRPWAKGAAAGPSQAVLEFLEENAEFRPDKRWEKFYFTFYPGGFLKKYN